MANRLYDAGRQRFLEGEIAWLTDNIKAVLVDTAAYTVNTATHQVLSDIPLAARVSTSPNLGGKTATAGVADADDVTFTNATGPTSEALVIFKDSGDPNTSPLILYVDTATGLPVIPNGGSIAVQWDSGPNKLFKL